MSAFEASQQQQSWTAENGSLLQGALHSALEAALLPARLAGRAWDAAWGAAGSAVGGSERAISGLLGALVGAAWGAATGGTELFIMSLQKLLQHTPERVQGMLPPRLLGEPEGGGGGGVAAERAAGREDEEAQAVGLGGGYTLNVASAEAAPEEPTPQAEPAAEREAEVAALTAKGGQFVEKAEPGIGVAAPREPVTPARAPAFAPLSPERAGLAAAPLTVETLPAAGALGAEPRSPVAKIDAHMRTVQEFRAKTAEILKAEEALPGTEEEAGAGLVAPVAAAGLVGTAVPAAEGRIARRSPGPLERIPSDVTGQEGRPVAPGLEALPEGPEGTSAEGSAHAGYKRSAPTALEAAAAGAGAALVPEKFEGLEWPYSRGMYAPAFYPGEEPALPPEAIAAVDLGDSEEEGEGPPPLASPSPAGDLEEEEAEQAAGGPEDGIFAPPAALQARQPAPVLAAEAQPARGEEAAAAAEGPAETAEDRLKGLFAPVGAAAATVGGFVGGGLAMAGAAAGEAAGAVAEALHIPGLSRAGPEEPAVTAEAGAAEAGEAEAAPAPELQPLLAPAGAAAVEAEQEEKAAAAGEAVERGPAAAAAEEAAVPAAAPAAAVEPAVAREAAAVPPTYTEGWEPGSEALLTGRSGVRVGVQRVHLPGLGREVTLESRIISEEKVEARRRHGHYWEHHHHHRHHQVQPAAEPWPASAAHRLASAAAGVAAEAVAPGDVHSRPAADRQRQLLRRLSSAAAALTGAPAGPTAEGGPLPAAAKPLLVGLAAVALMQSRLLGAIAAVGMVVLVAVMLLGLLLVEVARAVGSGLTGAVRWLSDPQVASEVAAAQKQRILEGRPAVSGVAAAAAVPTATVPSAAAAPAAAAAVPTPPAQPMLPALGEEAAETAEPAAAAEGLAAEHEALRAAAAELAAAEEAAVEGRPAAAAAVAGEELGAAAVQEEGKAKVAEEKAPAAAEAARPSPFEAEEAAGAVAAPAAKVVPAAEEAVAAPPVPEAAAAAAEKPVAAPVEETAVAAPPTPAKAAAAAPSKPEILPSTPAPAAAASTRAGAATAPKKKKRNPIHKLQKMMGLKPYSTPRS